MNIGLLVSGHLGFIVLERLKNIYQLNFVLTDKNSNEIKDFCKKDNISHYIGNPRNGKALRTLNSVTCDVLVSVNYLFLIEKDIIDLPKIIAINFHGSLLPKYRGRTPHVWAIINNESETGITAHKINEGCDTGDIISQLNIPISRTDTGGSILEKFNKLYPDFILEVLLSVEKNSYTTQSQNDSLSTYFGKRTKEDGQIDWNWHRERIYNWIRAQAKPYPRAFSYFKKSKIHINKIQFSDFGFHYTNLNGTILGFNDKNPIIKTPNGCIELTEFECELELEVNNFLK